MERRPLIRAGAALKARLGTERLVLAPGAYDCITARAIQAVGFGAVYMTGSGTAAAHGFPDFGLLTMSEMAANAARLADATGIPVIANGDTGFGNELIPGLTRFERWPNRVARWT